jgi:two-component system, NarL family, nitrate/nitrite response regulator NarL
MKVLVVDDHPVLREGLATLLQRAGPDTAILQAGDAAEALELVVQHADLDVVVLDLILPGMSGLSAITEFGRARPDLPVIVISSSQDPQDARRALALGALGYVPKSANPQTLLSAIRLVMDGELYVPRLILDEPAVPSARPRHVVGPGVPLLTERQIDVLKQLSEGQQNKAIAIELGLSEKTVKVHITAIFKALNVVSRTQAAAVARANGLIEPPGLPDRPDRPSSPSRSD